MQLVSIGRNPEVALSPPPMLTCDMVRALHQWLTQAIQPLARKHLGAPVIRVETMSSYSCRNAYGRATSKLSEHGRANALDIAAFVTAHGQSAGVSADWGMTAREITAAAHTSAPSAAEARALRKLPEQADHRQEPIGATGGRALSPLPLPGISLELPGSASGERATFGLMPPSRLGGPRPEVAATVSGSAKMDFLREAHQAACQVFATVLGPEANAAHHNHFHVDMAERVQNLRICD
jgi:hypothetical protein